MSYITELCFELTIPYPPKLKSAYLQKPCSSFVIQELLKDINRIVHNKDHPQVLQYTEALHKYKRLRCWFFFLSVLTLLIAAIWCIYAFFLCNMFQSDIQNCDYLDYNHNIITQISWTSFLIILIITVTLISCASAWFHIKSKHFCQEWRISIKTAVHLNIATRRKKSPQYLFELNYRQTTGFVIVRRGAGCTPTVDSSSKDYTFDTLKDNKKRRKRRKIKHIEIESHSGHPDASQELQYLKPVTPTTPTTPDEERTTPVPQPPHLSAEMLQQYARQNESIFNALVNDPSNSRLVVTKSQPDLRINVQKVQPQQGSGSQPNLIMNQMQYNQVNQPGAANTHSSSQTNIVMQSLPPVIPNPVDLDAINQPIHMQNNHYQYSPQNNKFNNY